MEAERRTRMGAKRSQQGGLFLVQSSSSRWTRRLHGIPYGAGRGGPTWAGVPGPAMGPGPVWVTLVIHVCWVKTHLTPKSQNCLRFPLVTLKLWDHCWNRAEISQDWDLCGSEIRVLLGEDLDKEQGSSQKLTFPHSHYEKKKKKNQQKITGVGEDVKKLEPLCYWWDCKIVQPLWNVAAAQKIKNRIIIWSSNSTCGYISKRIESTNWVGFPHSTMNKRAILTNYEFIEISGFVVYFFK